MGEPIKTRKGKLAGRGKHDARLGRAVQVKKRGGGNPPIELSGKEIFSNYDETKSKEEKNKKNGSKKKAHRRQGNIKMAVSDDRASCWVHKDLTVTTSRA